MAKRHTNPLEGLAGSKVWKELAKFLRDRREATMMRTASTIEEVWKREGAILELNILLTLPTLVAGYEPRPESQEMYNDREPHTPLDIEEEWTA